MQLLNKTRNTVLASDVEVANGLSARLIGLLGRTSLGEGKALWISNTNSIHTFFMKFPIDALFVDKNLRVRSIHKNLTPWRMTFPAFGAHSVFEMSAGSLKDFEVSKGDQLYVGS